MSGEARDQALLLATQALVRISLDDLRPNETARDIADRTLEALQAINQGQASRALET